MVVIVRVHDVANDDWDDGAAWGTGGGANRGQIRISMHNIDGGNGVREAPHTVVGHAQRQLNLCAGCKDFLALVEYLDRILRIVVPEQIAPWVPGGLVTLGTDGFGRSDTRERLRRFFEVDAECTVIATLYALAEKGEIDRQVVVRAIKDLGVDPEKSFPQIV